MLYKLINNMFFQYRNKNKVQAYTSNDHFLMFIDLDIVHFFLYILPYNFFVINVFFSSFSILKIEWIILFINYCRSYFLWAFNAFLAVAFAMLNFFISWHKVFAIIAKWKSFVFSSFLPCFMHYCTIQDFLSWGKT